MRSWKHLLGGFLVVSLVLGLALLLASCTHYWKPPVDQSIVPPPAPREFRAAWVATVANIDWPSVAGLNVEQQQKELRDIVEKAAELKLNALVVQMRTSCDALYPSELEPWSEYLTGKQGRAPMPYYDPLKMWIDEAHAKGIELHVWFNPYRARHPEAKTPEAETHIFNTNPKVVRQFNGWLWLDPAEEEASKHTLAVFMDVVKRYDIDGVHIDDYFYPYASYLKDPATGQVADFPDDPAWKRYTDGGGKLSRGDWRRGHVNKLVREIHEGVHRLKPHVKFGISPFGIWKPGFPQGVEGMNQYEQLYADAKLWLNEGWCDYFTPQLYWPLDSKAQPYAKLLAWWVSENTKERHIWPGLYTSKVGNVVPAWRPEVLTGQIEATRQQPGATGHVHFSMKALMRDRGGLATNLPKTLYKDAALVPASTWIDSLPPSAPKLTVGSRGKEVDISITPAPGEQPWLWAVYLQHGSTWILRAVPASANHITLPDHPTLGPITAVAVSAVDRCGNESPRAVAKR